MYAKSMIEHVRARAVAGAWSRHMILAPVAMALAVAVLPFTLGTYFLAPAGSVTPLAGTKPVAVDNPFRGLVHASVSTAHKRNVLPLDAQQRAVATFISRKYGVAADVVQELVRTAFAAGAQYGVDPLLVVAIMAVESSFNPIAESVAGAKGLMQVIPRDHPEKFAPYGGEQSVFDPRVNILVGARIVREYLLMASGDLFRALQTYAGALADNGAVYTHRVLNEKDQLDALAGLPKTDRGSRVMMQVEPQRPGTLTVPLPVAPSSMSTQPEGAAMAQPAAPAVINRPVDEAKHNPPMQPQLVPLPSQQPQPMPALNVTLLQREQSNLY